MVRIAGRRATCTATADVDDDRLALVPRLSDRTVTGPTVCCRVVARRLAQYAFRNLRTAELRFGEGVSAVVGPNGAGKSNLLAACYLGATGDLPGRRTADMLAFGADEGFVALDVERDDGVVHGVHVGLARGRKIVRLDDVSSKRVDVTRVSTAVLIEPSDVDMVHQGPSLRRHWMDDLLLRLSPRHASVARAYGRVLEQRNAALRAGGAPDVVDAFGGRLAELGEEITQLRERMIDRASGLAAEAYRDVAGSNTRLDLTYQRAGGPRSMHEALIATASEERARGTTVVGPHRDDVELTLGGHAVKQFASRGEARTVALALRAVEVRLLADKHGEPPILLVDDVAAELDARRRRFLVELTRSGRQAIVSGTDVPAGADVVFDVSAGEVTARA